MVSNFKIYKYFVQISKYSTYFRFLFGAQGGFLALRLAPIIQAKFTLGAGLEVTLTVNSPDGSALSVLASETDSGRVGVRFPLGL